MLDIFVDRLGREEIELERFLIAVAKFRETFAVRFRHVRRRRGADGART